MLDQARLRALANSWTSAFKREYEDQFPGDGDEAFCLVMTALWAFLLDEYEQEPLIATLNLQLARAGYKAVKIN